MKSEEPLRKALQQLPQHSAEHSTWQQLAQRLSSEETLQQSIKQLPKHAPQRNVWDNIESGISTPSIKNLWWPYAAAAALSLLIITSLVVSQHPSGEVITYSEEQVFTTETILEQSIIGLSDKEGELENEAWDFIEQYCQNQPVCKSPEFQNLIAHWQELDSEEAELQEAIDQLGHDPDLIKYQVRIQNMKADATKELIQLVL